MPTIEILPTEISEVREKVIEYFTTTNHTDDCLPEDLERIKDDEYQVFRFIYSAKEKGITKLDPVVSAMIAALKWRKEMNASRMKKEDFPTEFFQCGGMFIYGKSKSGSQLIILRVKVNKRVNEWADLTKKFIVHLFEQLDAANGASGKGVTLICDCAGAGISNVDIDILSLIVSCQRDHYPLLLNQVLVHECPFILAWVFKLVKSWLPEAHQKMLHLVNRKEMKEFVDEDQLPDFMGGSNALSYRNVPKGCVLGMDELGERMGINGKVTDKLVKHLEPFINVHADTDEKEND